MLGSSRSRGAALKKLTRKRKKLPRIGWREWIALPDLAIPRIKVKVDTGARSSALHAFDVERETVDGAAWVRFRVHPLQRDARTTLECRAPLLDERWVRSSSGKATLRPVIETRVRVGERTWPVELTLVRRDMMGFRMLLGRQALRRRFLVDSGRSYLVGGSGPGAVAPGRAADDDATDREETP